LISSSAGYVRVDVTYIISVQNCGFELGQNDDTDPEEGTRTVDEEQVPDNNQHLNDYYIRKYIKGQGTGKQAD
jgi:hypothetical protein